MHKLKKKIELTTREGGELVLGMLKFTKSDLIFVFMVSFS
jgi:hypothetical protein